MMTLSIDLCRKAWHLVKTECPEVVLQFSTDKVFSVNYDCSQQQYCVNLLKCKDGLFIASMAEFVKCDKDIYDFCVQYLD